VHVEAIRTRPPPRHAVPERARRSVDIDNPNRILTPRSGAQGRPLEEIAWADAIQGSRRNQGHARQDLRRKNAKGRR